jgi:transglutaminase-like putative cysteine protease
MAVVAREQMGGLAAGAVALSTLFATAAGAGAGLGPVDVPLVVVFAGLAAGAVAAGRRKSTAVLPPGKDVTVLTGVTVAGIVVLYLLGWTTRGHEAEIARLLPLAVVALAALWPEPNVLRYCLLLAAGTLLGATVGEVAPERWAVGGALVSMAAALVTTNRLTAASGPRLGGAAPPRGRRVATEAAAVLAVVGLLAALAASLVPPPPGQGGGGGGGGRGRGQTLPQPGAPEVAFDDDLDVGEGRGRRSGDYVLMVQASEADVWRAKTYDRWDGDAWSRTPEDLAFVDDVVEPGIGDPPDEVFVDEFGGYQEVTILARTASVLPAAARPAFASVVNGDVMQGRDASLYPSPRLVRGDDYIVFSEPADASARALRGFGDVAAAVPTDVADAYLQLPQVSPRVRALAAEITAGRPTTYAQARAVERWVDDHTKVTGDAKPVTPGTDPLEAFLFVDEAGPPERAATSMVVMLRAVGIPARLAVGFLPGKRSGPDEPFLVRSRDAHAWVEVWFPTVGWQRFDPTGLAPDPREGDSVWDRLLRFLRSLWPLLVALVVVGVGWLAWRAVRRQRRRAALPWSTRFFERVEKAGAVRGRRRRPQETPVEYAGELATGVLADPRLVEVGELVTAAAWSRHEPGAEDRVRAEAVLRAATKAAPANRLRRRRRHGPTMAKP